MMVVRSSCLAERGELQDTIVSGLGGLPISGELARLLALAAC